MLEQVIERGEIIEAIDAFKNDMRSVTITLAEYRELASIRGRFAELQSSGWKTADAVERERKAREQLIEALRAQVEEQGTRIATLEQALAEITGAPADADDAKEGGEEW